MEETTEKICPQCGQKTPGDSEFCVMCGTRVTMDVFNNNVIAKPWKKKEIASLIVAVRGVLAIVFIVNFAQILSLKKELRWGWSKIEGEGGSYILCILDFSDDEIEYRIETGYSLLDTTIATYDYKVVSGNKIKVSRYGNKWETVTVKFNKDKTVMTVTPALTSTDNIELWYDLN